MQRIILLILFSSLHTTLSSQEISKRDLIYKMIEVTESEENFLSVFDQIIELEKETSTHLDDVFWNKVKSKMTTERFDELIELIVPVYEKHFSSQQLEQIIEFYQSETGSHLLEVQPAILSESIEIGAKWGEELGGVIYDEIQKENKSYFEAELEGCESFKNGEFYYQIIGGDSIFISRDEEKQIEKFKEIELEYQINWIAPCRYVLIRIDESGLELQNTTTTIFAKNNKGYKYIHKRK